MIGVNHDQNDALVRVAAQASVEAGRYVAERFREGVVARVKEGSHIHDVVTAIDSRAEMMIRETLTAACPNSRVIGEELGASGTGEICWYVDPIDGTHNFVRGLPLFCVSIGVSVGGVLVGGAVYAPLQEELFAAANDRLTLNGHDIPPGGVPTSPVALTDIPSAGVAPDPAEYALFTDLLEVADVRRIGSSALALAYVAAGRAELAVNADVYCWDIAAGATLVTAAGGGVVAIPEEALGPRPGGFVAWRPGFEEQGRRLVDALTDVPAMRDHLSAW